MSGKAKSAYHLRYTLFDFTNSIEKGKKTRGLITLSYLVLITHAELICFMSLRFSYSIRGCKYKNYF